MGDDWVFGTVLWHSKMGVRAMFLCFDTQRPDLWWGMWLDEGPPGRVVRLSGRTHGDPMWLVVP